MFILYTKKCLVLLLFLTWNAHAQVVQLDSATVTPLVISAQLAQFTDTTKALTLTQVLGKEFVPVGRPYFPLPYSNDVFWFRITLRNQDASRTKWYIEWDNPTVELAECYRSDGSAIPLGRKNTKGESPYFAFDVPQGAQQTIFLRIKSQRGYRMTVNVHDEPSLIARKAWAASYFGFINGMVFLRLFFVLLLAIFAVRDNAFRAYCFLLVLRSLGYWGIQGLMGDVVTDDGKASTLIDYLSYHFIPVGCVLVVYALLPPKQLPKLARAVLKGILVVVGVMGVVITFDYQWYWLLASQYFVLFSQFFILGLYIYAVVRRLPINWYYSVPFLLGLGSYSFMVLGDVNIIDAEWVFAVVYFLFLAEILVFGLFLGKIILDYRRQQEAAWQKADLKEAQTAQLQELDAMKTNFFANISHEFRTPLTLLVGPLNDLREKYPQEKMIPLMQRNVRRLQTLINQILDLTKIESGKLKPALIRGDIARFLRPVFASFESLAQSRNIIFHYQQNEEEKEAIFDPDKLEKIVTNLLSNAFKFTPENGRIDARITYSDNTMVIRIKDNGIGIDQEHLPFVFDRFYQAQSSIQSGEEGLGIGLSFVRELVELLRGSIRVESQPDQGSTFIVELPTDATTWAGVAEPGEYSEKEPTPSITIESSLTGYAENIPAIVPVDPDARVLLLVEDNADLRAYIRSIFDATYQIVEATNGQNGLDKAFAHIPDLVICDVMMPRLNGLDFCKTLKFDTRTSHIPVIILSAKATLDDRLEGLKLGADDYLSKPFARAELELRVQNLLKQRDVLQRKYSEQVAHARERTLPADTLDEKFLNRAIRLVEENGGDSDFGINELCDGLNVSRSNLHRKLKALTNQSTSEFIRSIRIYQAAELLKDTTRSVSEVAYQVGFQSVSYFSKSFSEQMGSSPTEWVKSRNM